jgi:hypothetical protein
MDIPNPQPFKSGDRDKVVRYASLYCLYLADLYIQSCATGHSNNLEEFLEWADKRFWAIKNDIDSRANWDVVFKPGDAYKLEGQLANVRKQDALDALDGVAKFLYSNIRLYWDKGGKFKSNSLKDFTTNFLPLETKKIVSGNY